MGHTPDITYVLSLSYGKDSLACLEAIKQLGYPLDRVIHADVWATDTVSADLPLMNEFKDYADAIIKERYGVDVEHICATCPDGSKLSYEKQFYTQISTGRNKGKVYGFPYTIGAWCTSRLKSDILKKYTQNYLEDTNENSNVVQYLGIAADETERIERHRRPNIVLPLVDIGWDEAYCRNWCEENKLLSPIYTNTTRGGCWFCHNQSVEELRHLRKNYPDLWCLLMKWDKDSPHTFKSNGRTVTDFETRFCLEDNGVIAPGDSKFRWSKILH